MRDSEVRNGGSSDYPREAGVDLGTNEVVSYPACVLGGYTDLSEH